MTRIFLLAFFFSITNIWPSTFFTFKMGRSLAHQQLWMASELHVRAVCSVTELSLPLCDPMHCGPPGSSVHGDSPAKNTRVGCYALLQGIFPTHGLNPGLSHYRWTLYHLNHQGSPGILEWVAYPLSRESSLPRNQTGVSCIAGGFFSSWATRGASCYFPNPCSSCGPF